MLRGDHVQDLIGGDAWREREGTSGLGSRRADRERARW
jgi:hypothetical protein